MQSAYFWNFYVKEKLNFRESRFRELRLIDFLQSSLPTRKKFRKTIKMSEKLPCFQNSLRIHRPSVMMEACTRIYALARKAKPSRGGGAKLRLHRGEREVGAASHQTQP